ncbi:pyruvate-formate lyase-activating enzyme, predicted [Kipferlia bialata]|uniref:Pyruvate-formate lyase-activating enzyme, predicted n=1 Tax=Kipferlia bialata TaxID=797122 RepID=A0A9K3CSR9_9EUKA|nr:pyruvate-formate lyase-activating enzyme, predicted [Kipferlia bialata]|eukprot:g3020.t1
MEYPDNVKELRSMLESCTMCPRDCRVDRYVGWHGEEPCLVGKSGSGTIFLSGCNLHCVYCQNYDISQCPTAGHEMDAEGMARLALELQAQGAANINYVTPTHVSHIVAESICLARSRGLSVPTVYNCGGYESVHTLELLDGLIDIYMPDVKYSSADAAYKYSGCKGYPEVARAALAEMYRQVGPLCFDLSGIVTKGVLVRHLVLPGDIGGSEQVVRMVSEVCPGAGINVMAQYRPAHNAYEHPELMAPIKISEVRRLRRLATELGLKRVDH